MKTTDDGETFSDPVEITSTFEDFRDEYDWGVIAIGLPNGVRLRETWKITHPCMALKFQDKSTSSQPMCDNI